MSKETDKSLIHSYFDHSLLEGEKEELEALLRSSPEARAQFREIGQIHGLLGFAAEMANGQSVAASDIVVPLLPKTPPSRSAVPSRRKVVLAASSIAACLGLYLGISQFRTNQSIQSPTKVSLPGLARITSTTQFDWALDSSLPRDSQIDAGIYNLSFGTLRFEMSAGAAVCVSAPCEFEVLSGKEIRVAHGKLTARLPNKEDELIITMPGLKLTDLGTGFGVDVDKEGEALVSVFEGKVELDEEQGDAPKILKAGRSMLLTGGENNSLNRSRFDPTPFRDLWPLTLGIDDMSDLIRFVPPGPANRPLTRLRDQEHVFLVPEQQGVVLQTPLLTDLSTADTSWPNANELSNIPSGARVSSYLLFYNPQEEVKITTKNLTGTISFNREILGVICTAETLSKSDKVMGIALLENNLSAKRQLESVDGAGGGLPHDSLNLSSDRRSIHFNFSAREGIDNIRILLTEE